MSPGYFPPITQQEECCNFDVPKVDNGLSDCNIAHYVLLDSIYWPRSGGQHVCAAGGVVITSK